MNLDPHTPVIVGVGQAAERIDDPEYRAMSAVELAAAAARAAVHDCDADFAAVSAAIDTVAGVRQFEISGPVATAPLGRSNNYPRSVANRIGAQPARAILEIVGGQGPQHLISELAAQIAAGRSESTLIFGSDATSTLRYFARAEAKPDFTETVDGDLEDRGSGIEGLISRYTVVHGLTNAPIQYALLENARRASTGLGPAEYRRRMGELFAPFTKVAAGNPFAAAPVERAVDELIIVTERNRMISEPYPRLMVARDQVNQGAAALLMSVGAARRLWECPRKSGSSCTVTQTSKNRLCCSALISGTPRRLSWRCARRWLWPASASTTSAPSTCTAAFRCRCSTSATAWESHPTMRAA
jgi:acetyl-CoA C-acetyltransferase